MVVSFLFFGTLQVSEAAPRPQGGVFFSKDTLYEDQYFGFTYHDSVDIVNTTTERITIDSVSLKLRGSDAPAELVTNLMSAGFNPTEDLYHVSYPLMSSPVTIAAGQRSTLKGYSISSCIYCPLMKQSRATVGSRVDSVRVELVIHAKHYRDTLQMVGLLEVFSTGVEQPAVRGASHFQSEQKVSQPTATLLNGRQGATHHLRATQMFVTPQYRMTMHQRRVALRR